MAYTIDVTTKSDRFQSTSFRRVSVELETDRKVKQVVQQNEIITDRSKLSESLESFY